MQICPWASDVAAVKYESSVKYVPGYLNFYISLYFLPFFYLASRVVSELGVHKKERDALLVWLDKTLERALSVVRNEELIQLGVLFYHYLILFLT